MTRRKPYRREAGQTRIGSTSIRNRGQYQTGMAKGECACCDRPATHWVRIAYTYMRGEDEWENVCQKHHDMTVNNLARFFAHMRTRAKFVAGELGRPPGDAQLGKTADMIIIDEIENG